MSYFDTGCTLFYLRSYQAAGCVFPCSSVSLSKYLLWIQYKYFGRWCLEDIRVQAPSAQGYRFCFSGQEPWLYWHRCVEERRLNAEEWPWARKQSWQIQPQEGNAGETKHWRSQSAQTQGWQCEVYRKTRRGTTHPLRVRQFHFDNWNFFSLVIAVSEMTPCFDSWCVWANLFTSESLTDVYALR